MRHILRAVSVVSSGRAAATLTLTLSGGQGIGGR